MKIGCLGDIVFEVSDSVIRTLENATWSGSVSIQTHKRHLDNALQEFVSVDPDSFSFVIRFSQHLGVKPMEEIVKIWDCERNGITLPLTIGTKAYGKYRWLIKNHKTDMEYYDGKGNLTSAKVSITLTEYTRE